MGLVQEQSNDPSWGPFAQRLCAGEFSPPRNGGHDDKAHPPIHPIKHTAGLGGDEKRVYEYIVRRFLACCAQDAVAQETSIEIQIATESFHVSGVAISARNYLEVFPWDHWSDKMMPRMRTGDTFVPTTLDMTESTTVAPSLLTEHELIALMDRNGIVTGTNN